MKKLLTIVVVLSFSFLSPAAEWKYYYKGDYITGLSIYGSSTWIGTFAGGLIEMNTASGTIIHQYTRENSQILSNSLSWVEVDHNGVVWFTMDNVGIGKFDGSNWTFYTSMNSPIRQDSYWQLAFDNSNNVWVTTIYNGLLKFDGTNWTVYDNTNSPVSGNVRFVKFDTNNNAWVGDATKILSYNGVNWTTYDQTVTGFSIGSTRDACFDSAGNIYIASFRGLIKFDGLTWSMDTPTVYGMPFNSLRTVSVSSSGVVWMSATGYGIYRKNGTSWTLYDPQNSTFPDYYCRIILFPQPSEVYFATGFGGLVSWNGSVFTNKFFNNCNISTDLVPAPVIDASNNKWFGSSGIGLTKFDGHTWTIYDTTNSAIPNNYVGSIRADRIGNIWHTDGQSIFKYDGSSWQSYNSLAEPIPISRIIDMAIDSNSTIWIADQDNGIYSFDGLQWRLYDTSNVQITDLSFGAIKSDYQNKIWATGYNYSLGTYSFDGVNWQHFNTLTSSIPSDNVTILFVDSANNKWFSSDIGLIKYDGLNWTIYDTTNSGLPSNQINGMCETGNVYWISTYNGLVKFDGNNWTLFDSYNSGLPFNFYGVSADLNGNIWLNGSEFNENQIISVPEINTDNFIFDAWMINGNGSIKFCFSQIKDKSSKIELINTSGMVVKSYSLPYNCSEKVVSAEGITSGIYLARLTSGDVNRVRKVVLIR